MHFISCPLNRSIRRLLFILSGVLLRITGVTQSSGLNVRVYIHPFYMELSSIKLSLSRIQILYSKLEKSKLVSAWNEGFENNTKADEVAKLRERIDKFNGLFSDVKEGDILSYDFIPGKGTVVNISGVEKGVIEGKDFNDGLLRIWLGDKPVTKDLKKGLLSYNK